MPIEAQFLKNTLESTGARWQAADRVVARALGYTPAPGEATLMEREGLAVANLRQFRAMAAIAPAYLPALDWRNNKGNFVTPVKDQGQCGSCVAFGTCATLEAAERVKAKNPGLNIDLSEAHLFFCHVPGIAAGSCAGGWYPDAALSVCQMRGVLPEGNFPYTPQDQPCKITGGGAMTKVLSWHRITSTADMKSWMAAHGPLVTCMTVYNDFFGYRSGVYHHVTGGVAGGHCVCCVGYNDAGHYWICKNSWNDTWGEAGFFRIAYGDCGIDACMWGLMV